MHLTGQAILITKITITTERQISSQMQPLGVLCLALAYIKVDSSFTKKDIRSDGNAASEYLIGAIYAMDHRLRYVLPRIVIIGLELEK